MRATLVNRKVERVFALDEARIGLKVTHRRSWCPFGDRPPYTHDHVYKWLWLYVAVEPSTGESFVLFLPHTDGVCFEAFLAALRQAVPEPRLGVVLDNSGSHTSGQVNWPDGVEAVPLPPYSPELNPAERWFEALRRALANRIFDSLDELERAVTEFLRSYWDDPGKLQRLTGYPWWCQAVANLPPP